MVFIRKSVIMLVLKSDDDKWSMPAVAPFSGKHIDDEPFFSPDGCKIYFMSRRPAQGSKFNSSLWVVEKRGGKWGGLKLVKLPILSKSLHAPTISANNSVYDDGISIIQFKEGRYHDRESITGLSGMYPFVAPDESYIIYSSGYLGSTGADLFISCKNKNGLWSKGISLGSEINSSKHEGNSFLTTDGKYLFFSRGFDIYWVSAKFIEKLKQQ